MAEEELPITGIPTHFVDLDRMVNGFNNSHLIILAARPAMGKTALALNIAENICFKNRLPVGIFSLEMTAEQLVHRMVTSQAQVESDKIRTGSLNATRISKCCGSSKHNAAACIVIDDQPGLKNHRASRKSAPHERDPWHSTYCN